MNASVLALVVSRIDRFFGVEAALYSEAYLHWLFNPSVDTLIVRTSAGDKYQKFLNSEKVRRHKPFEDDDEAVEKRYGSIGQVNHEVEEVIIRAGMVTNK